jgi:radical SAM protein with 4Fe4S-binding SPASM domain
MKNHYWLEFIKSTNKKLIFQSIINPELEISTSPQYLILTLSSKCNLKCPHCGIHGSKEKRAEILDKDMDFVILYPKLKKILPFINEYSLTMSGEPLLVKNFKDVIIKLSKFGAKLNLVSNGTLINEKNIDIIVNFSSNICISIDGAKPEILEQLRKGANYQRLIRNVKNLVRTIEKAEENKRPNLMISCTIMGSNLNEMPGIVQLAADLGIRYVQFYPIQINNEQDIIKGESIEYHYDHFIKKLEESKDLSQKIGIQLILPNFENIHPQKDFDPHIKEKMIIPGDHFVFNDEKYLSKLEINENREENKQISHINEEDQKHYALSFWEMLFIFRLNLQEKTKLLIITQINRRRNKTKNIIFKSIKKEDEKLFFCEPLYKRVYISSEGDVAPCCIPGRPSMGNIFNQNLNKIWNGNNYRMFRKQFQSKSPPACCNNCLFRRQVTQELLLNEF